MHTIDNAEFIKRVKSLRAKASNITAEVQELAQSAIAFVLADGNADPAAHLLNAIGSSGLRAKGLAAYLTDFAPFRISQDKETGEFSAKIDRKRRDYGMSEVRDENTNALKGYLGAAAAAEVLWHRYTVENPDRPFDLAKFIKRIADKLEDQPVEVQAEARALLAGLALSLPEAAPTTPAAAE